MPERALHEGGSSGSSQPNPPRLPSGSALVSDLPLPDSISDGKFEFEVCHENRFSVADQETNYSPTFRVSQSDTPIALIIESQHLMAQVLGDRGFQCERHVPRSVNMHYTDHVPTQLGRGAYQLVWIDFPRKTDRERGRGIVGKLMLWLEKCSRASIPAFMFGPAGPHWRDVDLV